MKPKEHARDEVEFGDAGNQESGGYLGAMAPSGVRFLRVARLV